MDIAISITQATGNEKTLNSCELPYGLFRRLVSRVVANISKEYRFYPKLYSEDGGYTFIRNYSYQVHGITAQKACQHFHRLKTFI